ncbi:MAG: hypothetical protein QM622_02465 [Microbacterium sp.]
MIRRPAIALAATVLSIALTACAAETSTTSTSTERADPTSVATTSTAEPSPDPVPTGAACLVGSWIMGEDELAGFYADINDTMAGSGVRFTPTGSATMTLDADGAYSWAPEAEVAAKASGVTILVTFAGELTGTYSATDEHLTAQTVVADDLVITATVEGVETDAGEITDEISQAPLSDAAYTCTSDTLTMVSEVSGGSAASVFRRGQG